MHHTFPVPEPEPSLRYLTFPAPEVARQFGAPARARWRCSFSPPWPAARCLIISSFLRYSPDSWFHHVMCIVTTGIGMHAICIHGHGGVSYLA